MARWVMAIIIGSGIVAISGSTRADIGGLDSEKALYVGGTVTVIPEETEGWLSTDSDSVLLFIRDRMAVEEIAPGDTVLRIPYHAVTSLAYGQDTGRRVGLAIALRSHLPLFSKKRKHYLTVTYTNKSGREEAVVFELGKKIVRPTLTVLEVRTGRKVEAQDKEARKAIEKR